LSLDPIAVAAECAVYTPSAAACGSCAISCGRVKSSEEASVVVAVTVVVVGGVRVAAQGKRCGTGVGKSVVYASMPSGRHVGAWPGAVFGEVAQPPRRAAQRASKSETFAPSRKQDTKCMEWDAQEKKERS